MRFIKNFQNLFKIVGQADTVFYTLPWLMVLIVLGTVSQKKIGLYEAIETYFHSIILWLGPVPTPGGLSVISVIFISLLVKFLFFSKWNRKEAGIIITHLGILVLLLGGIITITQKQEGFMIIAEGTSNNSISDYRDRVLTITKKDAQQVLYFKNLGIGQKIAADGFEIEILDLCENCSVRAPSGKFEELRGLAENMEIYSIASEQSKEANFSGVVLSITGSRKSDGTYIVMEDIPKNPEISGFTIALGRAQSPLPFAISLQDFRKIDYPGTQKAREFESDLIVQDGDVSWPVTVRMNEPLRYKGYTFYQSSFDQNSGIEISVLNVVKNSGRLFPYISTFIIFLGMLLHLVIRLDPREAKA